MLLWLGFCMLLRRLSRVVLLLLEGFLRNRFLLCLRWKLGMFSNFVWLG